MSAALSVCRLGACAEILVFLLRRRSFVMDFFMRQPIFFFSQSLINILLKSNLQTLITVPYCAHGGTVGTGKGRAHDAGRHSTADKGNFNVPLSGNHRSAQSQQQEWVKVPSFVRWLLCLLRRVSQLTRWVRIPTTTEMGVGMTPSGLNTSAAPAPAVGRGTDGECGTFCRLPLVSPIFHFCECRQVEPHSFDLIIYSEEQEVEKRSCSWAEAAMAIDVTYT